VIYGLSNRGKCDNLEWLQGHSSTASVFKCGFHTAVQQLTRFQLTARHAVAGFLLRCEWMNRQTNIQTLITVICPPISHGRSNHESLYVSTVSTKRPVHRYILNFMALLSTPKFCRKHFSATAVLLVLDMKYCFLSMQCTSFYWLYLDIAGEPDEAWTRSWSWKMKVMMMWCVFLLFLFSYLLNSLSAEVDHVKCQWIIANSKWKLVETD